MVDAQEVMVILYTVKGRTAAVIKSNGFHDAVPYETNRLIFPEINEMCIRDSC